MVSKSIFISVTTAVGSNAEDHSLYIGGNYRTRNSAEHETAPRAIVCNIFQKRSLHTSLFKSLMSVSIETSFVDYKFLFCVPLLH